MSALCIYYGLRIARSPSRGLAKVLEPITVRMNGHVYYAMESWMIAGAIKLWNTCRDNGGPYLLAQVAKEVTSNGRLVPCPRAWAMYSVLFCDNRVPPTTHAPFSPSVCLSCSLFLPSHYSRASLIQTSLIRTCRLTERQLERPRPFCSPRGRSNKASNRKKSISAASRCWQTFRDGTGLYRHQYG